MLKDSIHIHKEKQYNIYGEYTTTHTRRNKYCINEEKEQLASPVGNVTAQKR